MTKHSRNFCNYRATFSILAFILNVLFFNGKSFALTCTDLDGSYIYSQELTPVYLGFFGSSFASDSIMNSYGTYGSSLGSLSVRNVFGSYGSSFSIYSANNSYTSTPPRIFKNGSLIAHLTNNSNIYDGISLSEIDANCSFYLYGPADWLTTQQCLEQAHSRGIYCSSNTARTCFVTYESCLEFANSCGLLTGSSTCSSLPHEGPNLTVYQPSSWSDALVIKNELGEVITTNAYASNTLYVDWAVVNDSFQDVSSYFNVAIYLDDNLNEYWQIDNLTAGYYTYVANYEIGQLSAGEHNIILIIDIPDLISESNESDNYISKTINVAVLDNILPTGSISYSTTAPTISSVVATLQPSEEVTVTSSGGDSHTFTENGSFTFTFTDAAGNTGSAITTVDWIDKTSPTGSVSYSTTAPTNGSVIATLQLSEAGTVTSPGGNTHTFAENGSFTFTFTDAAGNTGSAISSIDWISIIGDLNGDKIINLRDAIIVMSLMIGKNMEIPTAILADVDGNLKIGISEIIYILQEVSLLPQQQQKGTGK